MSKTKRLSNMAFLGLLLSSCTIEGGHEHLIFSEESGSESSLSSASASVSSEISDIASSAPEASTPEASRPSSTASLSSSDNRVYYTVSIYQSYYIDETMTFGNPRYDTSVKVEAGKPLFETSDEARALRSKCHEVYTPSGGTWFIDGFFIDETCTQYITSYMLVESDMNAYYYCHG